MKTILSILFLTLFLQAQERVLLHIGRDGKQEAIPLGKGQRAQDVIERIEKQKTVLLNPSNPTGLIDTLHYYPEHASGESYLTTNFGFSFQDVALQWYNPAAGGEVTEFWWRNYSLQGKLKKGTIRSWFVDPKLATRPTSVTTKHLGYYKDPTDEDGLVTPYKPASGDQWFYGNGLIDSATWNFDPLGIETPWLPGGKQVSLDSGIWQGIKLEELGTKLYVNYGQLFGFTLSNDSKSPNIAPDPTGGRMEILSWANQNPAPYHSYKFYETGRTSSSDKGWHLRGDYEWGMYVVIEYCTALPPAFTITRVPSNVKKMEAKKIDAYFSGFSNCFYPDTTLGLYLRYKNKSTLPYDSVLMDRLSVTNFTATIPQFADGDTVFYNAVAISSMGQRLYSSSYNYHSFASLHSQLFIYNNAQFSIGNNGANLIYNGGSSQFDLWSAPNDGTGELDDLLALYNSVVVADGVFPSRNIYPSLKKWLEKGTAQAKKQLFFTSQDYGCYITNTCAETTFVAGSFEYDYLGIQTLGPQDLGPAKRPYQLVPQPDGKMNYLINYNNDSSTTLWHYPSFELSSTFSGYPDAMIPKAGAKAIFKDGTGTNILGIINSGATFNTMFVAFDAGALQFRSDTSLHNSDYTAITDPKYRRLQRPLSTSFLCVDCEEPIDPNGVEEENERSLFTFSLEQNYPNPFNPTTVIKYQIPVNGFVTLKVFDLLGREVAQLMNEEQQAGGYSVQFEGKDLSTGLYFYQLQSGSFIDVKKMMLLK